MKAKKLVVGILLGAMLVAVPLFAGGNGKGFMGGNNANFVQGSGQLLQNGFGDGTMPRPMDGTGFGATNNDRQGNGQMLRDGSCDNQSILQILD